MNGPDRDSHSACFSCRRVRSTFEFAHEARTRKIGFSAVVITAGSHGESEGGNGIMIMEWNGMQKESGVECAAVH
jgi:hypothetical protein